MPITPNSVPEPKATQDNTSAPSFIESVISECTPKPQIAAESRPTKKKRGWEGSPPRRLRYVRRCNDNVDIAASLSSLDITACSDLDEHVIQPAIEALRAGGYLCSATLALCQNLIARSDEWKTFDPGYPGTWMSKPLDARSRRNWPRHLVFILYHGLHWTVGHLDQQSSTFHTYNSLPDFPINLQGIKGWIRNEFGKQFLDGLTFSAKVLLLDSSPISTIPY